MRVTPEVIQQRMREEGVPYAPYLSDLFAAYSGEVREVLSSHQGLPVDWRDAVYRALPELEFATFDSIYRKLQREGYFLSPGEFREALSLIREIPSLVKFSAWHEARALPDPRLAIPVKGGREVLYYAARRPYRPEPPQIPERAMLRDDPQAILLIQRQLSHEWERPGQLAFMAARSRTKRGRRTEPFSTGLIVDAFLQLQQQHDVEFRPWDGISPYYGGPELLVDDYGIPLTHVRLKP
jgi:hypothetical protein